MILFFDLETTGLNKLTNEIINIASVVYDEQYDKVIDKFDQYIKPEIPIPYNICMLTGITNDRVKLCQGENLVLQDFMNWLNKYNCNLLVGHNIKRFDVPFIEARCKKHSIINHLPKNIDDTLTMAQSAYKAGTMSDYNYTTAKGNISFKQEFLMQYWDLGQQTHTALSDVENDIEIYKRLKFLENSIDYGF